MDNPVSYISDTSTGAQPTGALTPVSGPGYAIRDLIAHGSASSAGSTDWAVDHSRADSAISCQVCE
jgi:hypothetical protein